MTTLIEAHERFAATLDELRRSTVTEFELWLKSALDRDPQASQKEAQERIATTRRKFADEFLDQRAPAIIRSLNRDAEFDILKELRTYEAKPEPVTRAPLPPRRWMPSLWRTVLAAAFGAVAGVILLTMQPIGEAPKAPPGITEPGKPAPKAKAPVPEAPAAETPAQANPPPPLMMTREALILRLLAAAFVAALGAALGVFIMACPPLHVLMERVGIKGSMPQWARNLGGTFLIFKIGPIIVLVAALLSGFFTLLAWLLGGSRPLHVAIGITALATVLVARWTAPNVGAADRDTIRGELIARLDNTLRADANVWAAMAAALVLKRSDGGGRGPEPGVKDITNIILARRAQNEAGEDILQVVEQQLGLPSGPTPPGTRRTADAVSEFVWKPEHAQTYSTFGIVEAGDVVTVSTPPLVVEDANGSKRVSQKGVVSRKRRGS